AGNNDALFPALFGDLSALTPAQDFAVTLNQIMSSLASTRAKIVVANIPDVTAVPYLTPIETFAKNHHVSVSFAIAKLGVQRGDYLRPSALPLATDIVTGKSPGPLQDICAPPIPGFPPVPCVLKNVDAVQIRATVLAYDLVIALTAFRYGAT